MVREIIVADSSTNCITSFNSSTQFDTATDSSARFNTTNDSRVSHSIDHHSQSRRCTHTERKIRPWVRSAACSSACISTATDSMTRLHGAARPLIYFPSYSKYSATRTNTANSYARVSPPVEFARPQYTTH